MPGRPKMTEQEKQDRAAVERYLKWLEEGDRSTISVARLQARQEKLPQLIRDAKTMITRLTLIQEAIDVDIELTAREAEPGIIAAFIDAAPRFSEARKISSGAWREIGVPLLVLQGAGITSAPKATENAEGSNGAAPATRAASSRGGLQDAVLAHIRSAGPIVSDEGHAVKEIADALGTEGTPISNAVRRLADQGLITREITIGKRTTRIEAVAVPA